MLDKNTSEQPQQVTLRIPFVSPIFTLVMVMVLAAIFLARIPHSPDADPLLNTMGVQGVAVLEQGQVYRLLSALVLVEQPYWRESLIVGVLHVLVSGYSLYIIGASTERLWGHLRFGLVYMLGGVAGILVSLLLVPFGVVPAELYFVAAPNAIMATLGGEVVYMYRHRKLYGTRGQQRQMFLAGLALVNLLLGAFAPRVDLFGLLGGLLGGAMLAWFVAPFHVLRPHPDGTETMLGEDANPLRARLVPLAMYITGLVGLLMLGMSLA